MRVRRERVRRGDDRRRGKVDLRIAVCRKGGSALAASVESRNYSLLTTVSIEVAQMTSFIPAQRRAEEHCRQGQDSIQFPNRLSRFEMLTIEHGSPVVYIERSFQLSRISTGERPR